VHWVGAENARHRGKPYAATATSMPGESGGIVKENGRFQDR
jgi:hypothetical protein